MSSRKRAYSTSGPSATFKRIKGSFARQAVASSRMSGRFNARNSARSRATGETGFVDIASANYAVDTTGTVTLLNTVPQGASVNQRVGKKIMLKSLQARGLMQNGSAATANDVAFLIVYDKRPTGALPSVTDILAISSAQSMNNDANSGRFVIMKRVDTYLIGNLTAATNYTEVAVRDCDFFLPLKGMPTVYKAATTGAIADIEEGALYLVTIGGTAAGTGAASLSITMRLRFVDV
ncbi:putative capsid protein [Sewage-associated circular DNA molecule-3]|uniref:Putative capsid protein n=1 Tax=Sewage-associated circular DNA molecule-3 TaxID=1592212 RepID=A0A0A7CL45_9VIRU|nr:putative capsid protein [Sewage-associated circular DNA molecule-3]AIF34794.1 putative capsid protein [Sewage-associated circular DNA molecule-3]